MRRLYQALGWLFCEIAFKADCRGLFAYSYRLGCWFYDQTGETVVPLDTSKNGNEIPELSEEWFRKAEPHIGGVKKTKR
jgi:hypothetical protein